MKIVIIDPVEPRFDGDFETRVAEGYESTPEDNAYLSRLSQVRDDLARDEAGDRGQQDDARSAVVSARRNARLHAAAELRKEAEQYSRGELAAEIAQDNVLVIKGIYVAQLERIAASLFTVQELFERDPRTNASYAVDVRIHVARDLPPPDNLPSPAKQALFVAISNTSTVIRTVCQRMHDRADRTWLLLTTKNRDIEHIRASRLLDQYMRKLAGVGRLGLEGPHVQLASLALESLREEFVAQEAGRIKNTYVLGLGIAATVAMSILLTIYAAIQLEYITAPFWRAHKAFLLAAAGAATGTWLSFSIRRVMLSFNDLAILEEDRLDPSVRMIFVIGLTMTACLLFWTGAINIEIGSLKTAQFAGATAFLIGLFSGIAERTLATAISGRAASFVRSVGGGGG